MWITKDGLRIITGSGIVLRSSRDPSQDMTYIDSIGIEIIDLSHSLALGQLAIIGQADSQRLQIYTYEDLTLVHEKPLPSAGLTKGNGKFVFYGNDGRIYVIIQAAEKCKMLFDYGIYIFD